ncbi:PspC domain-containing protein [Enterococcus sp. AZ109]|uniref:PspC domain-containing protein n=1 Tax=Enterococcus sp. AZ109 TaxID=2774634 RepID=UPI003F22F346
MQKRLTKSRSNVVLTGTLAGIAEFFGIDPTIVRVLYVFLSFVLFGSPVLLYIVLALLIPAGSKTNSYGHNNPYYGRNTSQKKTTKERKQAEPVDDDDWSDF